MIDVIFIFYLIIMESSLEKMRKLVDDKFGSKFIYLYLCNYSSIKAITSSLMRILEI